MSRAGVLLVGFGGPESIEAVRPFMCELTGREPSEEMLARVCARYERLGGGSPLIRIARELASRIESALMRAGEQVPVEVGMRYSEPTIRRGVDGLLARDVDAIAVVTLSPFETGVTHAAYREALQQALQGRPGVRVVEAPLLSRMPGFVEWHIRAIREALDDLPSGSALVMTAHSLPASEAERDVEYVSGLREVADAIARACGLPPGTLGGILPGIDAYGNRGGERPWLVAYQSAGARGGAWLGPTLDDVIDALGRAGLPGCCVAPIGFATDHLETLYDLDVVARERALGLGVAYARSALPNADARFAEDIAQLVRASLRY